MMTQANKTLSKLAAFTGLCLLVLPVSATLIGYEAFDGVSDGFLDGQGTQSNVGYAGTETWTMSAPIGESSASSSARGYNASTTGLSYSGLLTSGGSSEAFRTTSFKDDATRTASLPTSVPTTNTPETVYFSALINADGYTARADDEDDHGFEVRFLHESGGRALGFGFGGASGGDESSAKTLFVRGLDGDPSASVRSSSDLELAGGTNLVVLGISRPGGSGDNTYSLWLNPTVGGSPGTADWTGTLDWGIVVNDGSRGFYGFSMTQMFNGEQSVQADEFRFGTTFDSVTPIPEPSSILLMGMALVSGLAFRRWKRRG